MRKGIAAGAEALRREGPRLGRPIVDSLNGSRHANMKELRVTANKVEWRIAFAFDPQRQGVLQVAGAKTGSSGRFYRRLIGTADKRFDEHLGQ